MLTVVKLILMKPYITILACYAQNSGDNESQVHIET